MYSVIWANKDTTIYSASVDGVGRSGSNSGKSEISELFHLSESKSNKGNSRILMQFDLTSFSQSTVDGSAPTSSVEFRLKLKNANHSETLPSSYDVELYMITKSWDEGVGLSNYDEELKDDGITNWILAQSNSAWGTQGGDFTQSIVLSQHFSDGDEDLDIDVSPFVYSWLTGGVANNGLIIKLIDFYETGSTDYYVKKFYSRHAHRPERVAKIEARWEDFKEDDRENMNYEISGNLYFYRMIRGVPHNTPSTLFVDIINSSSTVVQTITASNVESGIYLASGSYVTFTSSTQIFRDVWFNGATQYFTGTFIPSFATGSQKFEYTVLDLNIPNLKPEYDRDQKVIINVFARERDYAPAVRKSASLDTDAILLRDAYYRIENDETEEVIVDYSTGSNAYSKLSYDERGNYFELWTDSLHPDSIYKLKILANYNTQKLIFDKNWTFKIKK